MILINPHQCDTVLQENYNRTTVQESRNFLALTHCSVGGGVVGYWIDSTVALCNSQRPMFNVVIAMYVCYVMYYVGRFYINSY